MLATVKKKHGQLSVAIRREEESACTAVGAPSPLALTALPQKADREYSHHSQLRMRGFLLVSFIKPYFKKKSTKRKLGSFNLQRKKKQTKPINIYIFFFTILITREQLFRGIKP